MAKSIYVEGFAHKNPIPAAARVGNMIATGAITGQDPATGEPAEGADEQARLAFHHLQRILEAAGAGLGDILKLTVIVRSQDVRPAVNRHWEIVFPDPATRPARHTLELPLAGKGAAPARGAGRRRLSGFPPPICAAHKPATYRQLKFHFNATRPRLPPGYLANR